jgi:hypothetical protein
VFKDSPLPTWLIMHHPPIHFAFLLILIGPLLIVVGAVLTPARGRGYLAVAIVLLLVGAAGLFLIA